jgi:iron complex outermembrane recepter protein
VMLEDVERIEVIRGPGASVWGANAVNGVINIVTKSSQDTRGLSATGGGGNEHREFGDFRVGGRSGNLSWRMYGMTMEDDQGYVAPPFTANDEPRMNQGGFRADWTPTRFDTITIQGDFYQGQDNQGGWSFPPFVVSRPMECNTNTLLTRWSRELDEDTDWAVQFYYYNPYAIGPNLNQVGTFDFDYQYHLRRGRHDVVWGLGYRNSDERWIGYAVGVDTHDAEQIPSYFIQDTITLVEDRFFVTVGSKFDHDSVTNFDYQPTARVTWTPDERTSIWGAISRAVRTPSLIERVYRLPQAEHVLAYEMGIRRQPTDRFYWELATFFNRYNDLLGSYTYQTYYAYANAGRADTYGFELSGTYEINKRWHLTAWYAFLVQDADFLPGYTSTFVADGSPRNQAYLQSAWDLGRNVSLDVMFRYVDGIVLSSNYPVYNYFAADIRLAWHPSRNLEMSVVGQNLLAGNHNEFTYDGGSLPTEVEPGVYGAVTWRY